jgi:hypothetical protein
MPIFTIKLREGPDIAVEGVTIAWSATQGSPAAVVYVLGQGNKRVAIIPTDALRAIYLQEAEKEVKSRVAVV